MALWRFGRGWNEATMQSYLAALATSPLNFDDEPDQMTAANGWTVDGAKEQIGAEPPGPPLQDDLFERARTALINYDFSDPGIVTGHFDPQATLLGRDMLLEIKVLGFRFLGGVRVCAVREESNARQTIFGFRYDTISGHIEKGFEWFLLTKEHESGDIWFQIEAHWKLGQFPNWWSKLGFLLIGEHYRKLWRHRAPQRLRRLAHQPVERAIAAPGHLAHRGDATPQRTEPTGGG